VLSRYGEIISVLGKYGLAEFVSHRPLLRRLSVPVTRSGGKWRPPRLVRENFGQRLRRALEELGPTFIKLGQILSDRADIIPESVVREMKKLQDEVPPFPVEEAKRIIEENLGEPVDEAFLYFYDTPEGAASLAQVHRAILPTGKPVAVKIKRPGIDDQIQADLQIMRQFAKFVDSYTNYFEVLKAEEIIDEFETQITKELDFVEEFLSLKKFAADYEDDDTIVVPEGYERYTTRDLLVQEFVHGKKVSEVIEDNEERFDTKKVNIRTADFIMSQLFINGYFHADPHPGNFLVLEGNIICFIDFGMVYSLRPYEQDNLNLMMIGLARLDPRLVARSLLRMGNAEGTVDEAQFESVVHDYIESFLNRPLEYIDIPSAFMQLLQMVIRFGIRLPPRLIYVAKVLGSMQTIGAGLDPDFQLLSYLRDFSPRIWANQLGSSRAGNRLISGALDWNEALAEAPVVVREARRLLRDRKLNINVPQAEAIAETYDRVGFRTTFALVLSSLLISSSLVVLADIQPQINGIPVFGIVGFGVGAVMGMAFLFAGLVRVFRWHRRR
ncbi:MAG: ABC1 kinase family protein, partial [Spirochaetota bacterium]